VNVRAAFIHVLGDGIQSIGVMIAAGMIWHDASWRICDPICTFLFSILVLFTTVRLVKQSAMVLMEGSPDGIDPDDVQRTLQSIKGVTEVHDLHIWSLSVGKPSLSVHMLCTNDAHGVLQQANELLIARYNIHHTTIQVEREHDQIHCNPKEQERRSLSPPRSASPLSPLSDHDSDAHRTVSDSELNRASSAARKLSGRREKPLAAVVAPLFAAHTSSGSDSAEASGGADMESGGLTPVASTGSLNGNPAVTAELAVHVAAVPAVPVAAAVAAVAGDASAAAKKEKPKRKKGGHGHSHGSGGGHGHSHGGGGGHGHAH